MSSPEGEQAVQGEVDAVIIAKRRQTAAGVELTLSEGQSAGTATISPELHRRICRLLGLPDMSRRTYR